MASGLRARQPKSYHSILGLKPLGLPTKKSSTGKTSAISRAAVLQDTELELQTDEQAERELFGGAPVDVLASQHDKLLDDLEEEDMETEQILALAAEEGAKCLELESEMEQARQLEEEQFIRKQKEKEEALQRLRAVRSKRVNLETSMSQPPSATSSPFKPVTAMGIKTRVTQRSRALAAKAGTSTAGQAQLLRVQAPAQPRQLQHPEPGRSDFNQFAWELFESVKQLKEGKATPFQRLISKTLADPKGNLEQLHKSESLPNVHFADSEARVVGSIIDPPQNFIPSVVNRRSGVKSEVDDLGVSCYRQARAPHNPELQGNWSWFSKRNLVSDLMKS